MTNKMTKTLIIVSLSLVLILSFVSIWSSFSYAASEDNKQVEKETEGPTRTNHKPTLKSNVTSVYSAYGIAGIEYDFYDHWLDYYFQDSDNDVLTYYASIDGGPKSDSYISTLNELPV